MEDWLAVAGRTWLAMAVLFIMTKLLGKRQVSQLSLFEYMTGLTIGGLVVYISLNTDGQWVLGVLSLLVWVFTLLGIEWLQLKSKRFRDVVHSSGTVLIQNGRILEQNMRKERLTIDEMMTQLRNRNAFHLADVEFAIMEPSGEINVLLKREHQPITLRHFHKELIAEHEPVIVLMDGSILEQELYRIGKDASWLRMELYKRGLHEHDVFIVEVNSNFQLFIDLFNQPKKLKRAHRIK
ncbi:DUF421 domain-containing protein [Paenibacillus sp. ACRRX]|uniref:DUF421 domain-containing protein n=1 Tax=unclassified Paenibacillus TaxID=185978 RepID=UPI001EF731B8|nr:MULTISPECIES: DUF421 domain-containing protein [unclassified Paenibacillus]MCG7408370.1 DUF421 domain-containing protein [Paenibacillus sp. ACRRX]MDK8181245.1 DUF421 domain-containing protein [Paenibacillus sp. UMB4589-SE434]